MKRHQVRTFAFALDTRASKPDGSYFEGYCAAFNSVDDYGSIMARGCFTRSIPRFLADGFIAGLNHDWDHPVGKPAKCYEDEKGLCVSADVIDTAHGLEVRKLLAAGICKKMSFGFDVRVKQYLERAEDVERYWLQAGYMPDAQDKERAKYGAVVFNDIEIYEASPVMLPANDHADITTVREGPPVGLSLDDHLRSARDAVEEIAGRVLQLVELRSKVGRGLAPERRAVLKRMCDRLGEALAASEPRADAGDVLKLRRELLLLESGLS